MKTEDIARVCHEANRALCISMGDNSQVQWDEAPEWQRESAIKGVAFRVANQTSTPKDQHESWVAQKIANGWIYGPVKDAQAKTHPCIAPYDQLPIAQQLKDKMFVSIVDTCLNRCNHAGKFLKSSPDKPYQRPAEDEIRSDKEIRRDLDGVLQRLKDLPASRERSLAITKLQESVMWLGMDLKRLGPSQPPEAGDAAAKAAYMRYGSVTNFKNFQGNPMPAWEDLTPTIREAWGRAINVSGNPYPASYDPTSTRVEPTADGLKL